MYRLLEDITQIVLVGICIAQIIRELIQRILTSTVPRPQTLFLTLHKRVLFHLHIYALAALFYYLLLPISLPLLLPTLLSLVLTQLYLPNILPTRHATPIINKLKPIFKKSIRVIRLPTQISNSIFYHVRPRFMFSGCAANDVKILGSVCGVCDFDHRGCARVGDIDGGVAVEGWGFCDAGVDNVVPLLGWIVGVEHIEARRCMNDKVGGGV